MVEQGEGSKILFVIDTSPEGGSDVPVHRYKSKFEVLSENSKDEPRNKKPRRLQTCFNCGNSGHSLRDCMEPRNEREVARNRKIFMESKSSSNSPAFQRYHIDEEQKFSHFRPGKLSRNLCKALGISSREVPPYIYKMRQLGYPLGWVEQIRVSHSGITMFDGSGRDLGDEEGEVLTSEDKEKFDVRKVISYPGFNVPPSSKVADEYKRFGAPPFSPFQSKEMLIKTLKNKKQNCTQTRVLQIAQGPIASTSRFDADMDFEETPDVVLLPEDNCGFIPPLPDGQPPPPPPGDIHSSADENSVHSTSNQLDESTSLHDLQSRKNELLAELNDTGCSNMTPHKNLGKIKTVDLGTPVLKSVSPYSRLPSAKNFSVDICDVINFENLPDSTGKYDKMSGLIRKVRHEIAKLQGEQ